jgi:hypothetical protein
MPRRCHTPRRQAVSGAARRTKQLAFAGRALAQSAGGQATPADASRGRCDAPQSRSHPAASTVLGDARRCIGAVTGIEAERPDGERKLLVLRQYNSLDIAALPYWALYVQSALQRL